LLFKVHARKPNYVCPTDNFGILLQVCILLSSFRCEKRSRSFQRFLERISKREPYPRRH